VSDVVLPLKSELSKLVVAVGDWADVGTPAMTSASQEQGVAAGPVVRRLLPELFEDSW
jgi:hypothetical protein